MRKIIAFFILLFVLGCSNTSTITKRVVIEPNDHYGFSPDANFHRLFNILCSDNVRIINVDPDVPDWAVSYLYIFYETKNKTAVYDFDIEYLLDVR